MTRATPRERAALAFAEIDRIDRQALGGVAGADARVIARKDSALYRLAEAMNDEFGALTDTPKARPTVIEVAAWRDA